MELQLQQTLPMPLRGELQCAPGELLALVGPSGAGKTSVLRVLAGLMRPPHGRLQVAGEVWLDTERGIFRSPQQRHVGMVFQHYALMPHLSARDNVALSLLHLPRHERLTRASAWLEQVQLATPEQARRPHELSGGQQQRVAMARALARHPKLLLLDEPFSAVDQLARQGLYRLLADLQTTLSIPMVLVTHDLHEARALAHRMAVIDQGSILQSAPPAKLYRAPRNARVADLVGIQNRFHGRWLGPSDTPGWGWLQWLPGPQAPEDGPSLRLRVRDKGRLLPGQTVNWVVPNDALLWHATAPQATAPTDTALPLHTRVSAVRDLGELSWLTLHLPALPGVQLHLTLSGPQRQGLALHAPLDVALQQDAVHVMPVHHR